MRLPAELVRPAQAALVALCTAATGLPAAPKDAPPPAESPFTHEAYVWQRLWSGGVQDAIAHHAIHFSALTVLAAEVSWKDGQPQVVRVPLDYSVLTNGLCPVGLALRIGPCPANLWTNRATTTFLASLAVLTNGLCPVGLALRIGPCPANLWTNRATTTFLASLAASLVAEARAHRLTPRELQIDFDCAEAKLDGYGAWVTAFRRKVAPVPLAVTALPSWLDQPAFRRLAAAAGEYVLQVHSLQRPRAFDAPFTLCDPAAARRAVERAAGIGVPFRVALPTYGYLTAFDTTGRFVGLSAEGAGKTWPEGIRLREIRANPIELAELVQRWAARRPAGMRGVIWYRLPVSGDSLNWRWPTLGAIVAGRSPRESFRAEPRRVEPGLVEINLVNDGELDISSRLAIKVRWRNARLVAGDGLRGFEWVDGGPSTVKFQTMTQPCGLPAGERQAVGWLRLSEDREVQIEIEKL